MIKTKEIAFKMLIIVSFIFAFMLFSSKTALAFEEGECGGAKQCECGDILIESQTMWYDIGATTACSNNGIYILPDIMLDCAGHSISGSRVQFTHGISLAPNVIVKNCNINNFFDGLLVVDADNSLIQDNVVSNNANVGMLTRFSDDMDVIANTFENNAGGLYILYNFRNLFDNNIISNNTHQGFLSDVIGQSQFTNNEITNNGDNGIQFRSSANNDVWNNTFVNNGAHVNDNGETNNYYIGTSGNHWDDFEDNPGYPNSYVIDSNNSDMYPNVDNPDTYCGGSVPCECGDTLYTDHTMDYDLNCNTAPSTATINIARDLVDLDCAGHSISGIGSGIGILNEYDSSSISNCNIDNFYTGLYLGGGTTTSTHHAITNNFISNNETAIRAYGGDISASANILLDGYKDTRIEALKDQALAKELISNKVMSLATDGLKGFNSFINNTIFDNELYGIISYGPENTFESNASYNNFYGITSFGDNDQLLNNNIYNNNIGFSVGGNYSTCISNQIYSNSFVGIGIVGDYGIYERNEIYSNNIGIRVLRNHNNISLNNFYDNTNIGLSFYYEITGYGGSDNTVWDNSFINNTLNAKDYGINNLFNSTTTGNFWDDYETNPGYPSGQYIIPTNGIDYFPISYTVDVDGDGYFFNANQSLIDEDCDDDNPNVNPGMPEIIFNGIDDNCNGRVDEHYKPRILFMREEPVADGGFWR